MADDDRRESLRGDESVVLDMLFQTCSDEQWTDLLEAPLERAAFEGNEDITRKLMKAGAGMGFALHYAIRARRGKVANILLDTSGAPVNGRDTYGDLPLHLAAGAGDTGMARSLLLKGAEMNASDQEGLTALYIAARDGHESVVHALLGAGADLTIEYPRPLLHLAAGNGHVGILRTLIDNGLDVDTPDPDNEETALHSAASSGKTAAIKFLIEAGTDLNARDAEGNTPLWHAVYVCSREAVLTLLKRGADVNAPNEAKETLLRVAAAKAGSPGALDVIDLLLRSGADEMMAGEDGLTPMDVVGVEVAKQSPVAEDVERVRRLLWNAPVDRRWRRRGIFVLCRAHPDRLQSPKIQDNRRNVKKSRSGAELDKMDAGRGANEAGGKSTLKRKAGVDWTAVAATVVGMKGKDEDIFRAIVGFL